MLRRCRWRMCQPLACALNSMSRSIYRSCLSCKSYNLVKTSSPNRFNAGAATEGRPYSWSSVLRYSLVQKRRVRVNDLMQSNYVYFCTEPIGKNFDPDFQPELTPKEMLELGVFGGKYMTDCVDEFPASWFRRAKLC